jgi:hypothetical protein
MDLAPDFDEFIGSLNVHDVEFLIVGAYALAFSTSLFVRRSTTLRRCSMPFVRSVFPWTNSSQAT